MKSRFSEEQIIGLLKQHEAGLLAALLCRDHNVSQPTFNKWKAKYGGMNVDRAKWLKLLEDKSAEFTLDVTNLTRDKRGLQGRAHTSSAKAADTASVQ